MKTPKVSVLIPFVITLIFIGVLYFIISTKNKDSLITIQPENKLYELIDKSLIEEKEYTTPTKYTTFDLSYPQFKNAPASFNKKIEDMVMDAMREHATISEEDWKARYSTKYEGDNITEFPDENSKLSLGVSYKIVQANEKFISVLMFIGGYSGGAHGYQNMVSFNYDLALGKEVTLASLFPKDPNYLKTISAFTRKDLKKQFIGRELESGPKDLKIEEVENMFIESMAETLNMGTEPTEENFNIFTFTPESVEIYFPEYQVASYVAGSFSVSMPRK